MAQISNVPRSGEGFITKVFEEIEGRVTKKLSQDFSRTENRILGALSPLDDFLMNPIIQGHSGTAPETSSSAYGSNQGTNEDDSQSDPHPEAGIFQSYTTHISGPEDGHDKETCFLSENVVRKIFQLLCWSQSLNLFFLRLVFFAVTFAFISYFGVSVKLSILLVYQIREIFSVTLMGLLWEPLLEATQQTCKRTKRTQTSPQK